MNNKYEHYCCFFIVAIFSPSSSLSSIVIVVMFEFFNKFSCKVVLSHFFFEYQFVCKLSCRLCNVLLSMLIRATNTNVIILLVVILITAVFFRL